MKGVALLMAALIANHTPYGQAQTPRNSGITAQANTELAIRNAALAQRLVAAINDGSSEPFVSLLSMHHSLRKLEDPDHVVLGGASAWSAVTELRSSVDGFRFTAQQIIAGRHFAAAIGVVEGQLITSKDSALPKGRLINAHAFYLAYVRNGTVRNSVTYFGADDLAVSAVPPRVIDLTPVAPLMIVTGPPSLNANAMGRLHQASLAAVQAQLAALAGDTALRSKLRKAFHVADLEGENTEKLAQVRHAIPNLTLNLEDHFSAGDFHVLLVSIGGTLSSPVGSLRALNKTLNVPAAIVVKMVSNAPEMIEVFLPEGIVRRLH
jgi:hypothetical protein